MKRRDVLKSAANVMACILMVLLMFVAPAGLSVAWCIVKSSILPLMILLMYFSMIALFTGFMKKNA